MKKGFKIAAVAAAFVAVLALAGCNNVAGTEWNNTMEQSSGSLTASATTTLKFNKDNTFTMTTSVTGGGITINNETTSGTYKQNGNKIEMTSEGVTITATLDGDTLVVTSPGGGASLTFKKQMSRAADGEDDMTFIRVE